MLPSVALIALAVLVIVVGAGIAIACSLIIAQPDEWLLCIRNGRLVKAGSASMGPRGPSTWRWGCSASPYPSPYAPGTACIAEEHAKIKRLDDHASRSKPRPHWHDGVRAHWIHQRTVIEPFVEPKAFETEPDGRTVVEVHQRVLDKNGNRLLEETVQHVYRIQDGLIRHTEIRNPGV